MIVYGSKYGAVRAFVDAVREQCGAEAAVATAWDARDTRAAANALSALPAGEPVFVVGPIYAGRLYGPVRRFVERGEEQLRERPLALALACLYEGERAKEQVAEVWPAWSVAHASLAQPIGGRVILAELPGPIRFLMSNMLHLTEDVDTLKLDLAADYARFLTGK